ncbi:glycosyltransferase [Chryseolinea soli]|uniref:Glycosyltransferase family 1 protein n=1 Tax=Chryseolinea soli TaxID=2321403 RepID=A0A385SQN0_9BACT|nr:glycosyltransferase [Chryseolinea soli]AYB33162.1 glycosyltransferase family 1 protein [Chryseolinea soli]
MPYNFVIFSLSPWNINYGANIKDLSYELAKHNHRVLYIDTPLKRKDRWLKRDKPFVREVEERIKSGNLLKQVGENLWHYIPQEILESVNQVKSASLFNLVNGVNNKRFSKSILRAVKQIGFDEFIIINDNEVYNGLAIKELVKPSLYVYYLRDKLSAMKYWKLHVGRVEPSLIQSADVVVANSEYLSDYAAEFNKHSYYVGQGCDVTHFLTRPPQADIDAMLKDIPGPIVGYMGAINAERLDISLIEGIATKMPDYSFVFIGIEDDTFKQSALHQLKNVYFLGKKDFSELPAFLYGVDVTINPQAMNEITIGNYPRKVDEYLAAGKPVVATKTHAMNPFREHVYLGESVDDYVTLIPKAIAENNAAKAAARRDFALEHTWKKNAELILEAIEKVKPAK